MIVDTAHVPNSRLSVIQGYPLDHSLGVKPKVAHYTHTPALEIKIHAPFGEATDREVSGISS
jgi:hypothetical protein